MMKFVAVKNKQSNTQDSIPNKSTKLVSKPDIIPMPTKKEIEQMEEIVRLFKLNESKAASKELQVENESNIEVDEESELERPMSGDDIPDDDIYELITNGVFLRDEVLKIELPKFMIKNDVKNVNVIEDKSTIALTLLATNYNQDIGKRIFGAIKNGFKEFKINFNDFDDNVISVWHFINAKIKTVDMGSLESVGREEPRTIMCEIEYDDFIIDNDSLI